MAKDKMVGVLPPSILNNRTFSHDRGNFDRHCLYNGVNR